MPGPSTVASSSVRMPISPSVALSATEFSDVATRIPDNAWVAARVETARETVESLEDKLFSFGGQLQMTNSLSS